jgi:hypothetical protein
VKKPTPRQLRYLRRLAERTGGTFAWPQTKAEASAEIERLSGRPELAAQRPRPRAPSGKPRPRRARRRDGGTPR